MRSSLSLLLAALVLAFPLACTEQAAQDTETATGEDTAATTQTPSDTTGMAGEVRVKVSQKQPFGQYLTDAEGMSLYLFRSDSPNSSTCYDDCAQTWPPLTTQGQPVAGQGANASMLDTLQRRDGTTQVTYGDWPLYYFAQDQNPGDTQGQDVMGFGAEWYLISPQGREVEAEGGESEGS